MAKAVLRLAVLLALAAVLMRTSTRPSESYPFVRMECTGQNEWVLKDGKEIAIRFDVARSRPEAVEALRSLRPEVLGPNAKGRIILQGELLPGATPCPGEPKESYQSFVLEHWYLRGPFRRMTPVPALYDGPVEFREKAELDSDDFHPLAKVRPDRYRAPR